MLNRPSVLNASTADRAPEGVSPRVFLNLRRMHEYSNVPLHEQLSFDFLTSFPFHRKEMFALEHGNI
jgi:hypothetical protein